MPESFISRIDYFLWFSRFVRSAGQKALPQALGRSEGFTTREEAAFVISKAAGALGIMSTMQYIDLSGIYGDYDDVSPEYNGAYQTVYKLGLMPETASGNKLDPKGFVTRAQSAVIFRRLHDILAGINRYSV